VRLIKLAVRSVIEWRRLVVPSVATVLVVSALITVVGSVREPIELEARRASRLHLGEYASEMTGEDAARLIRAAEPLDALVSVVSPPTAGVLDSTADLLLVRVSSTNLDSELAFRGLSDSLSAGAGQALSAGDAVLLAGGSEAEGLKGRVARLSTDARAVLTRILATGPMPEGGPELLIHAPETGDAARVRVRVRGNAEPLDAVALQEAGIAADTLVATDWLAAATERTAALRRAVRILVLVLASLAVATLIPGHLLLLDRAAPTFRLLLGWGFRPRDRGLVLVAMGSFASFARRRVDHERRSDERDRAPPARPRRLARVRHRCSARTGDTSSGVGSGLCSRIHTTGSAHRFTFGAHCCYT